MYRLDFSKPRHLCRPDRRVYNLGNTGQRNHNISLDQATFTKSLSSHSAPDYNRAEITIKPLKFKIAAIYRGCAGTRR